MLITGDDNLCEHIFMFMRLRLHRWSLRVLTYTAEWSTNGHNNSKPVAMLCITHSERVESLRMSVTTLCNVFGYSSEVIIYNLLITTSKMY